LLGRISIPPHQKIAPQIREIFSALVTCFGSPARIFRLKNHLEKPEMGWVIFYSVRRYAGTVSQLDGH
jgi:hypothetical protein